MQTIDGKGNGESMKHAHTRYVPAPGCSWSTPGVLGAALGLALVAYAAGMLVAIGATPSEAHRAPEAVSQAPMVPASQVREVELLELGPGWGMFMEVVGHE